MEKSEDLEKFDLNDMLRGWFIGDFKPTLYSTDLVEIGVKKYKKGEFEKKHFHKIATEYTVVVAGKVIMNEETYSKNDIIKIVPNVVTDFFALEDTITVVVKIPCVKNDKYEES